LTPQHAKRLLKAIGENIHRFEIAHGEIKTRNSCPYRSTLAQPVKIAKKAQYYWSFFLGYNWVNCFGF
jgi:hypothetical protein